MGIFSDVEELRNANKLNAYIKDLQKVEDELTGLNIDISALKIKIKADVAIDIFLLTDFADLANAMAKKLSIKRRQPNITKAITKLQTVEAALNP